MKTTTIFLALAAAAFTSAQNTTASLLALCNKAHDACDVAPNANHASCASEFFSCIDPNQVCGCTAKSTPCLVNPPTGNIFDCAEGLAECVVGCSSNSTSSTSSSSSSAPATISTTVSPTITPLGPGPVSITPSNSANGTISAPTVTSSPSASFTGAASKIDSGVMAVVLAGAVALL